MRKKLFLVVLIITLLALTVACSNKSQTAEEAKDKALIYGKWVSETGTLFEFTEDGRYTWYRDKDNTIDNFYKGGLEVLSGEEAMADLGISEEEYNQTYTAYANRENIYSVRMHFEILHSEGVDKSESLNKEDYYYFMFMISIDNEDEGIAISMSNPMPIRVTRAN